MIPAPARATVFDGDAAPVAPAVFDVDAAPAPAAPP